MPTIDYLAIANGVGANVESQAQYVIDVAPGGALEDGYQAGMVRSDRYNKTIRQSSVMSAAWATYVSEALVVDVLDDGDVAALVLKLRSAIAYFNFLQLGANADARAGLAKMRESYSVMDFLALLDGAHDDSANFADAVTDAVRKSILVPATATFAKLVSTVTLGSASLNIAGQGIKSMSVAYNGAGDEAFLVNATHITLRDMGISGIEDSGAGVVVNAGPFFHLSNVLLNWCGGDAALDIVEGISGRLTDVVIDNDSGYRPSGSGSDGMADNGIHVRSHASGQTNNCSMVNVQINSGSFGQDGYSLKWGDLGGVRVGTGAFLGGLIQGALWRKEVYARASDFLICGTHIECITITAWQTATLYTPGVVHTQGGFSYQCLIEHVSGVFATDLAAGKWEISEAYVVTLDGCLNAEVRNSIVTGGAQILDGSVNTGLANCRVDGVLIEEDCKNAFVRDCIIASNNTDPTAGRILDYSNMADLRNNYAANNVLATQGDNLRGRSTVLYSWRGSKWLGAAGAETVPAGMVIVGAPTVTRDTSKFLTGVCSAKIVINNSATDGFRIALDPVLMGFIGRYICVEAFVWVDNAGATAQIEAAYTPSGGSANPSSISVGRWERMQWSFFCPDTETLLALRFGGSTGAFIYLDSYSIRGEDFIPLDHLTLAATATPSVLSGPNMVKQVYTNPASVADITDFPDAIPGEYFTVFGRSAINLVNGANIVTKSGANIAINGKNATFMKWSQDGKNYEVG